MWLTPRSNWRKRYAGWPALKKLEYVDELMAEIAGEKPLLTRRLLVDPLSRLDRTLGEYYRAASRPRYAVDAPTDLRPRSAPHLLRRSEDRRAPAASTFLRHNRAKIRQMVAKWTRRIPVHPRRVLDDMIVRCRELKLRAVGPERQLRLDFTVLVHRQDRAFALQSRRGAMVRPMKPSARSGAHASGPDAAGLARRATASRRSTSGRPNTTCSARCAPRGHEVKRARRAERVASRSATRSKAGSRDVVFNLLEQFHGETAYDQNVASYLELLRVPYTGCNPRGLMLARGKDLSKKLLAYHRIPMPAFAVFPMRPQDQPPEAPRPSR